MSSEFGKRLRKVRPQTTYYSETEVVQQSLGDDCHTPTAVAQPISPYFINCILINTHPKCASMAAVSNRLGS